MKQEKSKETVGRRAFLRGAGLGAGAAGVAAVAATSAAPAKPASAAPAQGRPAGYRESEHVRRAYQLARF